MINANVLRGGRGSHWAGAKGE